MSPLAAAAQLLVYFALLAVAVLAVTWVACKAVRALFFKSVTEPGKCTVAFFHPNCNSGGGGERVLWCAIQALHSAPDAQHFHMVIYSGDEHVSVNEALARAQERFGLVMPDNLSLEIVYVRGRGLLEASRYPKFTMLGQSLGSMLLTWECLRAYKPDVFVDTTGCHFSFVVAKLLAGCRVACYVHYPTITTDMLQRVWERRPSYNNDAAVAGSAAATVAKYVYYRLFSVLYFFAGGLCDVIMVNSSWTKAHIDALWTLPGGASARRTSSSTLGGGGGASGSLGRDAPATAARRRRGSGAGGSLAAGGGSLSPVAPYSAGGAGPSSSSSALDSAASSGLAVSVVQGVTASLLRGAVYTSNRPASRLVYPPCNTDTFAALPLRGPAAAGRELLIISVGQFRPEKDHSLQLRAFAALLQKGAKPAPQSGAKLSASSPAPAAVTSATGAAAVESGVGAEGVVPQQLSRGGEEQDAAAAVVAEDADADDDAAAVSDTAAIAPATPAAVATPAVSPRSANDAAPSGFPLQCEDRGGRYGDVRLALVGGVRDDGDRARVAALRALALELGVSASVDFHLNVPFPELFSLMGRARVGIHTMWNEHFGIGVVEMMAAGVIPVAHASGGPLADIVVPLHGRPTGFLAATPGEYADALAAALDLPEEEALGMAARAREHACAEFSDARFGTALYRSLVPLVREGLDEARERRQAAAALRK